MGGCLRRGVYEQTHWKEKKMPDAGLQEVFEEGHMQEDACRPLLMQWLKKNGLVLRSGPPRAKEWDGLSGSIDGYIEPEMTSQYRDAFKIAIEEFKTLEYHRFESIGSIEDFRKSPYMTAWLAQIQTYMLLEEIPIACFVLKSKQAMRFKSFWMELDYEWAERLLKVRDEIKKHVAEGTLPDKVNNEACVRCSFGHICMPDLVGSGNFELIDNTELAETLDELAELEQAKKRIAALERARKKLVKPEQTGICGNWLVGGKYVEKKAYTVEAGKYWKSDFEKLDLPTPEKDAVLEENQEAGKSDKETEAA
jgi:CRISPR/Cas system-associated exonuclease Cas4 (RecB family)